MRPFLHRFPAAGGLLLLTWLCAAIAGAEYFRPHAPTIIVTSPADNGAGSLRQALADAQDGDTIQFDPALNGQTIFLTSSGLAIAKNITISGPGPNLFAVKGFSGGNPPTFSIMPGHMVIIEGLTIRDGAGIINGAANLSIINCIIRSNHVASSRPGAIYNDGSLAILDSTVTDNDAVVGGGIYNGGSANLSLQNSSVDNNIASYVIFPHSHAGDGGGIYNAGGNVTITGSSVSNNTASDSTAIYGEGGGIYNTGTLTIINSTINNNQCPAGGGIANDGTLTITGSTVSSNIANGVLEFPPTGYGGGVLSNSVLTISNSTISSNTAHYGGGGIYGGGSISNSTISNNVAEQGNGSGIFVSGVLELGNTILNADTSGTNIYLGAGTVTSHGYNLSSDNAGGFLIGPGDQINTDPILGPLQDNGGPTFTHELLTGSPAVNAGDPSFTPPPFTDQRGPGYARVFNGRIDIGSFEVQPTPPPITISGTISYCSNPLPGPVPNVVLTLTGSASGTMPSDGAGNYIFSSLASGGTYTVTPSKAALAPASPGINTVDVVTVQRYFLSIGTPLSGCRLAAADVNGDNAVNTTDVIAIQRFFLGLTTGIANVGKYQFNPAHRTYPGLISNQTGQNYDALVLGDIVAPFVE